MSIIRRELTARWKALPNAPAEDSNLSFEARGMLWYLLVKPDDWQVMVANLINASPAGRDKVYRILGELVEAGYVERDQGRDDDTGQRTPVDYVVRDNPLPALPDTGEPDTGEPDTANPTRLSTHSTPSQPRQKTTTREPKQRGGNRRRPRKKWSDGSQIFVKTATALAKWCHGDNIDPEDLRPADKANIRRIAGAQVKRDSRAPQVIDEARRLWFLEKWPGNDKSLPMVRRRPTWGQAETYLAELWSRDAFDWIYDESIKLPF